MGRRTGRAEQDEHAEGVHYSEMDVDFKEGALARGGARGDPPEARADAGGVVSTWGSRSRHRLDHLLSGVRAQIAVKLFGQDLDALRARPRS